MKENRDEIVNIRTTQKFAYLIKEVADRFFFSNKSNATHHMLKFISDNQKTFEKWIEAERKKSADQSLV